MKLKLLALLTILLLASMSCKKKDDDTSPTAPKTTLSQRAGTYIGVMQGNTSETISIEITSEAVIIIDNGNPGTIGDKNSNATSFTFYTGNSKIDLYTIDFENNTLKGLTGTYQGITYNISKK